MFIIPFMTPAEGFPSASNTDGIIVIRSDRSMVTRNNASVTARSSVPTTNSSLYGALVFDMHLYNRNVHQDNAERLIRGMFSSNNEADLVAALEIAQVNGLWETRWCKLNDAKSDYVPTIPYSNSPAKKYRMIITLRHSYYTTPLTYEASDGGTRGITPCVNYTFSNNNINYHKIVQKIGTNGNGTYGFYDISTWDFDNYVASNQIRFSIIDASNPSRSVSFTEILSVLNKVGSFVSSSDRDEFVKW